MHHRLGSVRHNRRHVFGFKPTAIYYLYDCINNNIGVGDVSQMNIKGLSLADADSAFTTAVYSRQVAIDKK
ncbi:MAG: hypothetical protein QME45_13645 [Clostridiales bacterium]|nr:hypothetical protein [Clostridiales bacterium]